MGKISKELLDIKKKVSNQKFEMKKNQKLQTLQSEVNYFQEEALHFRE
jgi:hypothetical protein